jgi:hypothetical protein
MKLLSKRRSAFKTLGDGPQGQPRFRTTGPLTPRDVHTRGISQEELAPRVPEPHPPAEASAGFIAPLHANEGGEEKCQRRIEGDHQKGSEDRDVVRHGLDDHLVQGHACDL